jgi:hypothetical protein
MLQRNVLATTKPDIIIENAGNVYSVTSITSLKAIKITFTLGTQYEADPGYGWKSNVNIVKLFNGIASKYKCSEANLLLSQVFKYSKCKFEFYS